MDSYLNVVVANMTPCYGNYIKNNTECAPCVLNTLCKLKLVQSEHPPTSNVHTPNMPVKLDGGEALDDIFAQLMEVDVPF